MNAVKTYVLPLDGVYGFKLCWGYSLQTISEGRHFSRIEQRYPIFSFLACHVFAYGIDIAFVGRRDFKGHFTIGGFARCRSSSSRICSELINHILNDGQRPSQSRQAPLLFVMAVCDGHDFKTLIVLFGMPHNETRASLAKGGNARAGRPFSHAMRPNTHENPVRPRFQASVWRFLCRNRGISQADGCHRPCERRD